LFGNQTVIIVACFVLFRTESSSGCNAKSKHWIWFSI